MQREVVTCVLLVIVMAPALVQAAAPAQKNDMRPLGDIDIWVNQLSSHYYCWTQLNEDAGVFTWDLYLLFLKGAT